MNVDEQLPTPSSTRKSRRSSVSKAWHKMVSGKTPKSRRSRSVVVEAAEEKPDQEESVEPADLVPQVRPKSPSFLSKVRKSMGTPRRGRKSTAVSDDDVHPVVGDLMAFTPSPTVASCSPALRTATKNLYLVL